MGTEETTVREQVLLEELLTALDQTTALLHTIAQSYGMVLRRTGEGRLSRRDGEMVVARVELQVEGLRERVRKMGEGWRRGGGNGGGGGSDGGRGGGG